jgi:ADP-ribose pyrophosphatase YjhB (NUDIX family)
VQCARDALKVCAAKIRRHRVVRSGLIATEACRLAANADEFLERARAETGLDITDLRQMHTYSDPARDPRFHTVTTVFIAKASGRPKAGSDAAGLKVIKTSEIENFEFAFDHKDVLRDYLAFKDK